MNDFNELHALYHHGIKGQKWGVRRFQNEDGTLTKEGKDAALEKRGNPRFINSDGSLTKEGQARYEKQAAKAQELGDTQAKLESMTRELHEGWDGKSMILVTSDFKNEYTKLLKKYSKAANKYSKDDVSSEIKTMDDGYDYVITRIHDKELGGAVEYYSVIEHSDELAHFGIFGMKWGIRRFQNEDGTLTEAGKVRYKANPNGVIAPKGEGRDRYNADVNDPKQLMIEDVGSAAKTTTGAVKGASEQIRNLPLKTGGVVRGQYSDISDAELQKRINRLSLEQRYSDLVGDTHYVKSGGDKVKEIFQTIGATAGVIAALTPLAMFVASHIEKKKK